MLLEAINDYHNNAQGEAQLLEVIVPEPVVEGSQQQEAGNLGLAGIVGAIEEEHRSTRSMRGTLMSQSSTSSPGHVNFSLNNNSGVMINWNVGNHYRTIFKNCGNNNSMNNHYR